MKRVVVFNLFNFLFLLWLELLFHFSIFHSFILSSVINIILYTFFISVLITLLTTAFSFKVNKIILYIIYSILPILYSIQLVFKNVFNSFFSFSLLSLSDQVLAFKGSMFSLIFKNIVYILLFFIPLILLIIFRKKIKFNKLKLPILEIELVLLGSALLSYSFYLNKGKDEYLSGYSLVYEVNQNALNIEKLGVLNAYKLDLVRTIFGFEEKIVMIDNKVLEKEPAKEEEEEVKEYLYNKEELDLDNIKNKNSLIYDYIMANSGSKQNEYTGLFKGKNLIFIVAESFSEIAISKELTPTLYKLTNSGLTFNNFYTPNYLSTIGGEFQALTGLHPSNEILSRWRSGTNYFPYGLATVYENLGYKTYAYHNNSGYFQDRNKYLKSLGFKNFKACYIGLNINCNIWPQSDVEMINATIDDYLDSPEPFMAYYMTVSGHFEYNFDNAMAKKHYDKVKDLPYSNSVKAYIGTEIELDEALQVLLQKLEEKDKLKDTVIVLLADHYPYALSLDEINEVSAYKRDETFEINHNKLIIYNPLIETTNITKVASSSDVLPTIYNLFGIKYDSRLFTGSDILSTNEGLVIFQNRSWISDKAIYNSRTNTYVNRTSEKVDKEYIDIMNNIVSSKLIYSKEMISKNGYELIFPK